MHDEELDPIVPSPPTTSHVRSSYDRQRAPVVTSTATGSNNPAPRSRTPAPARHATPTMGYPRHPAAIPASRPTSGAGVPPRRCRPLALCIRPSNPPPTSHVRCERENWHPQVAPSAAAGSEAQAPREQTLPPAHHAPSTPAEPAAPANDPSSPSRQRQGHPTTLQCRPPALRLHSSVPPPTSHVRSRLETRALAALSSAADSNVPAPRSRTPASARNAPPKPADPAAPASDGSRPSHRQRGRPTTRRCLPPLLGRQYCSPPPHQPRPLPPQNARSP